MAPGRGISSVTCWMLLAVFSSMQYSAQASRFPSAFQQSTNFSDVNGSQMMRIELLHRDHPLSPMAPAEGTTLSERLKAAAKRSQDRHLSMSRGRRLAGFTTPVTLVGAEYVISVFFGTPPQQFTGLVDTGSDLVWIQCDLPCIRCFEQPHPIFDPTSSSSEVYVPCSDQTLCNPDNLGSSAGCVYIDSNCHIKYAYLDGSSIQGVLTMETMTLTNTAGPAPSAPRFVMGCMNNNDGTFNNVDGIIGFGRGPYSLPSQFSAMGDLKVFSICLVSYLASTTFSSSLIFGTRDSSNALGLVYTPILPVGITFYSVEMVGARAAGVDLAIPTSNNVVFDSGTTLTYLAPAVYDPILESVASLVSYPVVADTYTSLNLFCFSIAGVQSPMLPTVTLHFAGVGAGSVVDLELGWENLFLPAEPTVLCLGLVRDTTLGMMIIGNVALANHYVEHDADNMRLGWTSKDCTA